MMTASGRPVDSSAVEESPTSSPGPADTTLPSPSVTLGPGPTDVVEEEEGEGGAWGEGEPRGEGGPGVGKPRSVVSGGGGKSVGEAVSGEGVVVVVLVVVVVVVGSPDSVHSCQTAGSSKFGGSGSSSMVKAYIPPYKGPHDDSPHKSRRPIVTSQLVVTKSTPSSVQLISCLPFL